MMKIKYTPLDEAAETIKIRRNNEEIQEKLGALTLGTIPDGAFSLLDADASAVYAEYVARPTIADVGFARLALSGGLEPWWATYNQDTFTTTNKKKTDMLRPPLLLPNGQSTRSWIVAGGSAAQGAPIGLIETKFKDMRVCDYWTGLRNVVLPKYNLDPWQKNVVDLSSSYKVWSDGKTGSKSMAYYPSIMGLFATRAVLFVDYERFPDFKATAEEGYEKATNVLGVEPVIVQYNPENIEAESLDPSGRTVNQRQTDLSWLNQEQLKNFQATGGIEEAQ